MRQKSVGQVPGESAPAMPRRREPSPPASMAARWQVLQRLAGNGAVAQTLAVQRDPPTREENIASLRAELAAAAADVTKWKAVALRLNGFDKSDFAAIAKEIPDKQLQGTRVAVELHLSGWPNQAGLLVAVDARGKKRKVSLRPSGASIWATYSQVGYNVWSGEAMKNKVWEHVGGSVGRKYENGNTCAARLSWAFNNGGFPLSGRGEVNNAAVAYKGKKGDGQVYVVWVPSMQSHLRSLWGKPDAHVTTNQEAVDFEKALKPGEVAVFAGPHHGGVIKQGYSDAYVKTDPGVMPVDVWKLP